MSVRASSTSGTPKRARAAFDAMPPVGLLGAAWARVVRLRVLSRRVLRAFGVNRRRPRPGAAGERQAERHLTRAGYRTMMRNARVAGVEVDLVMLAPDAHTVVIVEVKSRRHDDALRAVPDDEQRRRLRRAAGALSKRWPRSPVHIELVQVLDGGRRIEHRRER